MNKVRWTMIAAISLLVFLMGWIILFRPEPGPLSQKVEPQQSLAHRSPAPALSAAATPAQETSIYKTDPRWIWWNGQRARDPDFEWKMPISFFGAVIDQNDQPVSNVKVVFQWTDMSSKGTSERTTYSGNDGRFELTGVTGKNLGVIQILKEGYYGVKEGSRNSFEYAAFFEKNYHQPDPENPIIFRLRKKGEVPKELVVRETMMSITPNGAPHWIDLATTRKTGEGQGDIAIRITRTAPVDVKEYDWEAAIEGVNGAGVLESADEFMFEAPEAGYEQAYTYQFRASDPEWKSQLSRKYFVRAKNGRLHGRLELDFIPKYQNSAAIAVRFFVNPTGARVLEYEPNKVLPR